MIDLKTKIKIHSAPNATNHTLNLTYQSRESLRQET